MCRHDCAKPRELVTSTDPLPNAADAEYLTAAFHRARVASGVRVLRSSVDSISPTITSQNIRLPLIYGGVTADAPASVILKVAHPGRRMSHWTGGQHEVVFYRDVAIQMTRQFVPRCFDAQCDPATGDWHLVLEDLTETHAPLPSWPRPPSTADCARILTTRARFHAA